MAPTFDGKPITVFTNNAFDCEVSPGTPDVSKGAAESITVDADVSGSPTWALLKFIIPPEADTVKQATLSLFPSSGSDATISAYRMLTPWDDSYTWSSFGANGIALDDVIASSTPSFTITAPASGQALSIDVTLDVEGWIAGDAIDNQGWVFVSDSTDDFVFNSANNINNAPSLSIIGPLPQPSPAPVATFDFQCSFFFSSKTVIC